MPKVEFRTLFRDACAVSFLINNEGVFLFVWPFELALLWSGAEA
jgi:hypothetical protein